ncbi:MAG: PaaI family thioesterase [Clostridiales bacterium]|nr:PaaI family thioesterase [Clostridiales bacterium]
MKTLEEVREFFKKDQYAMESGVVIEEVQDGYARCVMELNEHHKNAMGAVMGGAIFTLADFTFAVASNWNKGPYVSLTAQITYLGKTKGNKLIAEAKLMKEGRTTCYYLVEINDDLGNQVAHVTMSGFAV